MEYNSDIGEPGTAAAIEYDPDLAWVLEDIQRDLEIQQLLDDSVPADNGLGYQNTDWYGHVASSVLFYANSVFRDWNTPGFGSTWTIDEWFNVIVRNPARLILFSIPNTHTIECKIYKK